MLKSAFCYKAKIDTRWGACFPKQKVTLVATNITRQCNIAAYYCASTGWGETDGRSCDHPKRWIALGRISAFSFIILVERLLLARVKYFRHLVNTVEKSVMLGIAEGQRHENVQDEEHRGMDLCDSTESVRWAAQNRTRWGAVAGKWRSLFQSQDLL